MIFSPENFGSNPNEALPVNPTEEPLSENYRIEKPQEWPEAMTALLKAKAFDLLEISQHLIDGQNEGWASDKQVDGNGETLLKPYAWNVNSGVLLFNDGEKTYVTRATDELLDKLHNPANGYTKNSAIGVPHVNNPDVWKDQYAWTDFASRW